MSCYDFFNKSQSAIGADEKITYTNEDNFSGKASLEELLTLATPSRQGLYPHEIIMLEYAPFFKTGKNTFQQFWSWQYLVTNPQSILDSLYDRDFIKKGNLRSALEELKIPTIKEELKLINQKKIGNKDELINRLLEFGDLDALNQKYSERHYVLTSKGERELEENQYVSYLHRNRYMTVWEMNRILANTRYSYREILWDYFNQKLEIHYKKYDFGLYRNTLACMYQFLKGEKKLAQAFHLLCEVLSYDLSGLENGDKSLLELEKTNLEMFAKCYETRLNRFFSGADTKLIIPPGVINWFADMQNALGMGDKVFRKEMLKTLNNVHTPRRIFTNEESADIVLAGIHKDEEKLSKIFNVAEEREKAWLDILYNK